MSGECNVCGHIGCVESNHETTDAEIRAEFGWKRDGRGLIEIIADRLAEVEQLRFELSCSQESLGEYMRLHAEAHAECSEQARLLGMSGERELALLSKIERLRNKIVQLQSALERIEPVPLMLISKKPVACLDEILLEVHMALAALHGKDKE